MKIYRSFLSICLTFFTVSQVSAQFLSFDKLTYNYGIVKPGKISKDASFYCTNTGKAPIVITKIEPSTEAISYELTRDTLQPGNRSAINVFFNTKNTESLFSEYIDVYTTDKMLPKITLHLEGTIKNLPSEIEDKYPSMYEVIRLSKINIAFGTINYPSTVSDTIMVYNPQDTAVTVLFPNVPNYMNVQIFPETIQPNSSALMIVSLNSKLRNEWGIFYDRLHVGFVGQRTNFKKRISINGLISEDLSKLTKSELKKAPHLKVDQEKVVYDTVTSGEPATCKIHFTNTGKSVLEIRKIKTSCGCTAGTLDKYSFAKSEEGDINITINTRNKRGNVRQTITIISNDPQNQEKRILVEGFVRDVKK